MGKHEISEGRKTLYYAGMVLTGIGLLSFLSTFLTAALNFGRFDFNPSSMMIRAFGGIILCIIGSVLMNIGRRGLAGSGIVLDPEQAREDVKPWNVAAGGMVNDAVSEIDVVNKLARRLDEPAPQTSEANATIKIRCRSCKALNDENAKFCNQCGEAL